MFQNKTDSFLYRLEEKTSLPVTSFLTGIFLIGCAMLYTTPGFQVHHHGYGYSVLSEDPFNFAAGRDLQYRILGPLLGYILHLRGDLFFILPLIFGVLFLAAIYFEYRKKNFSPFESLLMGSFISFSCTILIPLVSPGYTDTISYFFLFLSFSLAQRNKQWLSAFCFMLAVFNHESNFFLLPSLLLMHFFFNRTQEVRSKSALMKTLLIFTLLLIPYWLFRFWISYHTDVRYSAGFYFSGDNLRVCLKALTWAPAGFFFTFKLFWFFPFYIIIKNIKGGTLNIAWIISAILFFTMIQLVIAFDVSRMICLAFPSILLSAENLRTTWGQERFISFSRKLMCFNFFILPYFAAADGVYPILPFIIQKIIDLNKLIM